MFMIKIMSFCFLMNKDAIRNNEYLISLTNDSEVVRGIIYQEFL